MIPNGSKFKLAMKHRRMALVALAIFIVFALFGTSDLGFTIENLSSRRLDFLTRERLKAEPALNSRIKIFAWDSATLNGLERDDLEAREWLQVIDAIRMRQPKIILIDKVFTTPRGDLKSPLSLPSVTKKSAAPFPDVVAGSYLDRRTVIGASAINIENPFHDLGAMLDQSRGSVSLDELDWLPITPGQITGPHRAIRQAFSKTGHLAIADFGLVKPLVRPDKNWAVKHWAFWAGDRFTVAANGPVVNDVPVPLDRKTFLIPNLVSRSSFSDRAMQFQSIIYRAKNKMVIDAVDEGDVVVILPNMFPGNKDYVDTPRGRESGGLIVTSIINSVLNGNWIKPVQASGGGLILMALLVIVGSALAAALSPLLFFISIVSVAAMVVIGSLLMFSQQGIIVPWLFPVSAMLTSGGLVFYDRARRNEKRLANLRTMMHGKMSDERIDQITKDPDLISSKPVGKIVSIMFIDIVGFSQLSDQQTPQEAFMHLKKLFEILRGLVLKHNGVVDKTLGDGMLAYFGYGPDGREASREHADEALNCGIDIQRAVLDRNLKSAQSGGPIYPLRIGINTSAVFVGNIGDQNHFDFTMIGNGVNLAKRFESACAHNCVMIGPTTFDMLLHREELPGKPLKRLIMIKHAEKPIESWEINPFAGDPAGANAINTITKAHRKLLGIDRKDPRFPVPAGIVIAFETPYGKARLVDFSINGIGIVLDKFIGGGTQIEFQFDVPPECVADWGRERISILGEVRWGKPSENSYLHGIQMKNLSAQQCEQMITAIRTIIRGRDQTARHNHLMGG